VIHHFDCADVGCVIGVIISVVMEAMIPLAKLLMNGFGLQYSLSHIGLPVPSFSIPTTTAAHNDSKETLLPLPSDNERYAMEWLILAGRAGVVAAQVEMAKLWPHVWYGLFLFLHSIIVCPLAKQDMCIFCLVTQMMTLNHGYSMVPFR
jgi:hypothetical protein